MPELPEVEHVKRGIVPYIVGQKIIDITFSDKVIDGKASGKETIIKGSTLEAFRQYSIGYTITDVVRRSKYLLFSLEQETIQRTLISHLGMAGGFFVAREVSDIIIPNYRKHWHVIFHLDNDLKLIYSDIRRFGEIRNVSALDEYPSILDIAPEPFHQEAEAHFLNQFEHKKYAKMPIKQMILDHRVIAGCGNIYACEALFDAGIHPQRQAKDLSLAQRQKVFKSVVKVLEMGIVNGGTSISDYVHADGQRGTMQNNLNVYKQKECSVCGQAITTAIIGGRNTHYCEHCQQ
ncbi:bifunctional DNA-formamidopyrimidine glycosylase/DNA-(apurinic or apyrimidinic site) lyase [Staphylococcus sp. 17KM0847]|uniref:bifunctional DNA-formamidopyrimidine glycosylase/DNA-(apurinic or apyrimidinic site) lyase n=1 Tax=Staphylococcus sp. 17KM0847 TaxID=2583989 RepID=UPI0015DC42E5|nr:bifunctional DNA-formamidopyrimidine glycosylase/DNA-(apurinic or apyrimidinic site) lyase [Staphylococcus sp. 17KM0847]QLK85949.1 bifunctional DNA-formamidopyrimidine glycosylase/DNA-(apurinic or apyrimidinic site) lyase [Staphylococcus sp. 17KM0847]